MNVLQPPNPLWPVSCPIPPEELHIHWQFFVAAGGRCGGGTMVTKQIREIFLVMHDLATLHDLTQASVQLGNGHSNFIGEP